MKTAFIMTLLSSVAPLALGQAAAQTGEGDCIENVAGEIVCGQAADAVRARIRAEAAYARGEDPRKPGKRTGSVYGGFGQGVFLRGGYIFAAHGGGASEQAGAPMAAAGYRRPISKHGRNHWSLELEGVYARDSEDAFDPLRITGWGITGLAAIRWEYATDIGVNPFLSAGVGPSYWQLKIDDGVSELSDGVWAFGYSGRAGVAAHISPNVAFEAGYRYLGATREGTFGVHAAEAGLNFNF